MEAMILAAGLGTRLRPLTNEVPKALVEVAGVPMLERVARRLVEAGADRLVINVHHHAEQVERFVEERDGFGVAVAISREEGDSPLETGGGLLHAEPLFRKDGPFLLHNVDIVTDVDLRGLHASHLEHDPLVTLAVDDRDTTRPLLFDDDGLFGWADRRPGKEAEERIREPVGDVQEWGFAGIHVLSPEIFGLLTERGKFSIVGPYLRLAAEGYRIRPHDVSGALWLEVGTHERLEEARKALAGS